MTRPLGFFVDRNPPGITSYAKEIAADIMDKTRPAAERVQAYLGGETMIGRSDNNKAELGKLIRIIKDFEYSLYEKKMEPRGTVLLPDWRNGKPYITGGHGMHAEITEGFYEKLADSEITVDIITKNWHLKNS